ncbi:hypothetical protein MYAM1_002769 [Malassezia yamatoensis]|uniref:chitin deacetylase n=1 Tax=Malassezia yamatoensis TaxID=253288 RepID=A0AAJ5YUI8_9BASI|nr:hypothetical protein MYAM1_002769 [Malassezia yamatoensis]
MKWTFALTGSAAVLASASVVSAHVGRGFAVPEPHVLNARSTHRSGRGRLHARASPTTDAEEAKIEDATQQCKAYGVQNSAQLSKVYPKVSEIADIVSGDDDGGRLFEEILNSNVIPSNIQPRGSTDGNMGISDQATASYDTAQDPDCWWTATTCTKPKTKGISSDLVSCPEPNTWGLTFDDGPNCSHNAFYDYLLDNKLRATMFYIGTNVMDWPLQAQRGVTDGHDICVHTWSHHYMTTLTTSQVFSELYYTMRIIKDVTGVTPRCWRPPFGDVDNRVRAIADALGLRTIIWDNDTDDWNVQPEGALATSQIDQNYQEIISQGTNGTTNDHGVVVLTHELTNDTMSEFIKMYPKIKKAYKHVVPLTACYNATTPYQEDTPTYPNFADFVGGTVTAKGLPSADSMNITVKAAIKVVAQSNQTDAGGFSPAAMKKNANAGTSQSSSSQSSQASGSGSSSSQSTGSSDTSNSGSQNRAAKSSAMTQSTLHLGLAGMVSAIAAICISSFV